MNDMVVKNGAGQPLESPLAGDLIADGATMEQIKTPFHTAVRVQKPRESLSRILARIEEEALISGEEFYYGWGAGGNRVEGPSIKLANAVARVYGNCVVMPQPVQETKDSWIFTSAFIDLETGYTNMRQFRQSKKWQVYGKFSDERKDDIRFQIGQSKANRNTVINSVPPILIKKAMEKAKAGVRQKIETFIKTNGIQKAIEVLIKEFAKVGIKEESLEMKYAKKLEKWDIDIIVLAKGDLQAIQDGAESAANLFPDLKEPEPAEKTVSVGLAKTQKQKKAEKKPKPKPEPEPEPEAQTDEPVDLKDQALSILIENDVDPKTFEEMTELIVGKRVSGLEDVPKNKIEDVYNELVRRYGLPEETLL